MYLQHFGLSEPPFKITPVTDFFFNGANRKEILDALIYSISEVEGIIKVSGEVGSGKTMLCRMLLEKLPEHIETIYLANPSLSREEMLYAIADALDLNIDGERVGIIMQRIQGQLEEKARENKRVVVLVDEAHAMPNDTLEELRLLYNLQVGNFKLLQIVLFGQPELNAKLEQPNMRQLKDRIVHHFIMQPISRDNLENYLMFRMRTAGYHGPNIFSATAIKLIANASNGLMRRANILADKSLLAAFVAGVHFIEARHIHAAIRDSELSLTRSLPVKKLLLGSVAVLAAVLAGWWFLNKAPPATMSNQTPAATTPKQPAPAALPLQQPALPRPITRESNDKPVPENASLFEQRLSAGKQLLAQHHTVASIQLFYSKEFQSERMEGFLNRADGLGKLADIYLLPARFGQKQGLRVLYGAYPSVDAARNAIKGLPQRYQKAFATTTIYIF
ncbi:MAG TPA: AAA family ATPase [Gallionella sp.]|nr:AAA family ATPase [Gallionella sp.]